MVGVHPWQGDCAWSSEARDGAAFPKYSAACEFSGGFGFGGIEVLFVHGWFWVWFYLIIYLFIDVSNGSLQLHSKNSALVQILGTHYQSAGMAR